jgi:serine/threonine protein kinase
MPVMTYIHDQILPEGTQLGVYEIKAASRIDTFDITYRAWNNHLKESVEIQEYFPHDFAIRANDGLSVEPKSPGDKENFDYGLKAFVGQAEALSQIEHPNIVKAENVLQFNGTAYLIMDYQEGGVPLSKLVKSPATITETELKFILVSILNALQKVHENKIVHGGIQPETIILGKNGAPFLTNFVGARIAIAAHTAKLADELIPSYAAPELYGHANEPGRISDFYALGATMHYCITHRQPIDAQSRRMAVSKGEPDPLASVSGSQDSTYSVELLQAIDWMLRPEYNDRPQSASEILVLLKSESISSQGGQVATKQDVHDVTDSQPNPSNPLWLWVMAGILGLAAIGFWLTQKPSKKISDNVSTAVSQTSLSGKPDRSAATPTTIKEDQTVAQSSVQSSQKADLNKIAGRTPKETNVPEKKPSKADEKVRLKTSDENSQLKKGMRAENGPMPASKLVSKPGRKAKQTSGQEFGRSQKIATIDKSLHQPKKQILSEKPSHEGSIKSYLAAAKKSMKELRFTRPPGDSAYKYYRMVLDKDPDNAEAQAGLQKIVNKYAWVIKESKAEGKLDKAKRVLKKAESVLPNDPKLHKIRAELAASKK